MKWEKKVTHAMWYVKLLLVRKHVYVGKWHDGSFFCVLIKLVTVIIMGHWDLNVGFSEMVDLGLR